ncbi:MAG: aldo/keto reductase [Kordiimonadaceae bacterium]|nr:aldo/keto reductase [Kordiimonadaceae bacterium]
MDLSRSDWNSIFLPGINRSVSRIAFGCEALGGFNWGDVDIDEIQNAIYRAIDGIRPGQSLLFDTADTYGPHLSEERLGEALAAHGDKVVVATKFGVRLQDGKAWYDNSASYADQALDHSLGRLQRDCIDLYQLHWPDGKTPLTDTLSALEKFREEGRIKAYGVCNVPPVELLPLVGEFPGLISFSQSYSLIERADRKHIQALCRAGLVFIAYGCLAQGLLSGKYNNGMQFGVNDRRSSEKYKNFHGKRLIQNLAVVEHLLQQADTIGLPVAAFALQFVLADLPGAIALAGVKSADQWAQNVRALQSALPEDIHLTVREVLDETMS